MQTTNTDDRRKYCRLFAPSIALLLLSSLAIPASAQRGSSHGGRGGSDHHGRVGGHSGHRGGDHRVGSHRSGRGHGYRGHRTESRRHSGYRGSHGYRGYSGYGSHRYGGYDSGYRGRDYSRYSNYRGHSSYRYNYPSYYRDYYRPYVYYQSPGYYGFGYSGPGVSIHYDGSTRYGSTRYGSTRYGAYAAPRYASPSRTPSYASALAIPERVVDENGELIAAAEPNATAEPYDARQQPARVKLSVEPGDASVYLDGRFLGLASELPAELLVDPGLHRLEVVRPGFAGRQLDLELTTGEALDVDARLEAEASGSDPHR